jgi:CubicO group peptidase (beta-lactamase class C family)
VNAGGDTIPFRRGADGKVSGFVERGTYFARRTPLVDVETIASVRTKARALGADGRPRAYTYARPVDRHDGIAVGDAAAAGIDPSTVARLVGRVVDGTYPDVHSILVYRGGRLVVEEYFYDYDADRPHQLRSATKSVVSALVGIAIDRGMLESDTARVMRYLPHDVYANADPRKDRLTIRDLLTMRSGLACDDWEAGSPGNESRMYRSGDWVKFVLDLPMTDAPGTRGRYCSGNVAVAGRIVEGVAHTTLPTFARQQLFAPLGIRAQDVRWNYTLDSTNAATFAQVYLRPRDMLKLGMLYQQGGRWNGRQIISRDWVARSIQAWSTVGDQPYGYFWWHQWVEASTPQGPRRVDMVDASGNGGQKIYLVPSLDLIVVLTGGNYNVSSPATGIMANEILPAVLSGSAAPRRR